jgi:hypothetical protein
MENETTFEMPASHDASRLSIVDYFFRVVQEKFESLMGLRHRDRTFYLANLSAV